MNILIILTCVKIMHTHGSHILRLHNVASELLLVYLTKITNSAEATRRADTDGVMQKIISCQEAGI
jgi:hypothetical protein